MIDSPPRALLTLSGLTPNLVADVEDLVGMAVEAEAWGAGGVILGEHVAWVEGMHHPGGQALSAEFIDSVPDSIVLLSAIASRTTTSWLVAGTLVGALRHPLLVARQAATLSRISRGRFHLGMAAGWSPEEFAALGIPFEERFSRMDEVLRACASHWASPGVSGHHGRHFRYDDVLVAPRPWSGRVPIWIGGGATERSLQRVVAQGDGWIAGIATDVDEVARGVALLRAAEEAAGREVGSVRVLAHLTHHAVPAAAASLQDRIERLVERTGLLRQVGATDVVLPLGVHAHEAEEMEAIVRAVVGCLAPGDTEL